MKFLVVIALFAVAANCAPAINSIRGSHKFQDRPGKAGSEPDAIKGEYKYVDENGYTHLAKYVAGPKTGFKIIEDKIQYAQTSKTTFQKPARLPSYYNSLLTDNYNSVVKVHHIRNEVPATVHKTHVPESVHAMAPPPVFSRRFIDIHELPVYI